uniref:Uncharacterized protein n=1 Tax=Setaria italica TaxID=4555 RepID=K3ZPE7_SETIT
MPQYTRALKSAVHSIEQNYSCIDALKLDAYFLKKLLNGLLKLLTSYKW